ncbi:antitoxin VbhA family protein [Clostridium sp. DL1XJH146]
MVNVIDPKEEKRKAWEFALGMNQIYGKYIPSDEMKELIEKNINEEITTDEIIDILIKKYTKE